MATVVVTFDADAGERDAIRDALPGHDVRFLRDGPVPWEGVDALLVFSFHDVPDDAFPRLARLRIVQTITAGTDHVPVDRLPRGVAVAGASGSNADEVAEHAMALLLAAARRVVPRTLAMRDGRFRQDEDVLVLKDATVAVIGLGPVGQAVATRLRAFGSRVLGVNRSGRGVPAAHEVVPVDRLDSALPRCRAVVVAVPLTKETLGLIDAGRLALLPDDAVLVNVARGRVVDQRALFDHLTARPRFTAGLDVWWEYPAKGTTSWAPSIAWGSLPNVVMTPHVAGTWPGFRRTTARWAARGLARALSGASTKQPPTF